MSAATWLSFDPGGKRTGVAAWNSDGSCRGKTIYNDEELDDFLEVYVQQHYKGDKGWGTPKEIIYEPFRVRPDKAASFAGSSHVEIQVIGKLKLFARLLGIPAIVSKADLRTVALWAGIKVPAKGHIKDDISAYLHGYWHLHTQGIIKARVLENYK